MNEEATEIRRGSDRIRTGCRVHRINRSRRDAPTTAIYAGDWLVRLRAIAITPQVS